MSSQPVRGLVLVLLMVAPLAAASHDMDRPLEVHKPDLFAGSVTATGEDERTPTTLCFEAYNFAPQGQGVASFFDVRLRLDVVTNGTGYLFKEEFSRSREALPGAGRLPFCWGLLLPAGTYRAFAAVDTSNEIEEVKETNNANANGAIVRVNEFPKANLRIPTGGFTIGPGDGREGTPQIFRARVYNDGEVKSIETTVIFRDENGEIGRVPLRALAPDEAQEVYVQTDPALRPAGRFTAFAIVDPENLVVEYTKTDNAQARVYSILPHPLPDLTIGDLRVNGTLLERRALRLEADVKNVGNRSAGTTIVQLQIDGVPVANATLDRVSIGAARVVTFPFYLLPGNHSVRVLADPESRIVELDESNNANTTFLNVDELALTERHPNLVIDRFSALPDDPGPGEAVTLNAYIRNVGERPSGNATIAFYANGVRIGEARIPPIEPDRYHSARLNWTNSTVGAHTLRAYVDSLAELQELHEDDNNDTLFVTILAPRVEEPPPRVDAPKPAPPTPSPGNATNATTPDARPPVVNASDDLPRVEIAQVTVSTREAPGALKGSIKVALRNPRLEAVGRMTILYTLDGSPVKEVLIQGIAAAGVLGTETGEIELPSGKHTVGVEVRMVGNQTTQASATREYDAQAGAKGVPGLPLWGLVAAAALLALRRKKPDA